MPVHSLPAPMRVHMLTPLSFNDAQEIGDRVKSGSSVFLDMRAIDRELEERLRDFLRRLPFDAAAIACLVVLSQQLDIGGVAQPHEVAEFAHHDIAQREPAVAQVIAGAGEDDEDAAAQPEQRAEHAGGKAAGEQDQPGDHRVVAA